MPAPTYHCANYSTTKQTKDMRVRLTGNSKLPEVANASVNIRHAAISGCLGPTTVPGQGRKKVHAPHLSHLLFSFLVPGRKYHSLRCRTASFKNSFYPTAIRSANSLYIIFLTFMPLWYCTRETGRRKGG